jgi:hypothetical protein
MKPIIMAAIGNILIFLIITICLRQFNIIKRAFMMIIVFMLVLPILITLYIISPNDFYYLPQWSVSPHQELELIFALFLYFAGFWGGILQLYNLADRGFSLRILIDIKEDPSQSMTLDEVITGYSKGLGIDWMYQKRLNDMQARGLIEIQNEIAKITKKGIFVADLYKKLRYFISYFPNKDEYENKDAIKCH